MSQVSLYLQSSILSKIENAAKEENLSISTWVKQRLESSLESEWPNHFFNLFGAINDPSFQKPKALDFKNDSKRESF